MNDGPVSEKLYSAGDQVRIAQTNPPGHRRIPGYIRGKNGVVERYCGAFPNPEELAYGFDGLPKRHLYRVRFRQADVWQDYDGSDQDTVDLEVQEHWLSKAD
ncbi:MAG: nitrile hydratase subunit beta [Proteobacteria bacterium]|nr:nitrile hydratase subunit beta [Pseudomonadota bacterium]